ncbi:IclR family transcriptional regulator [Microbacterium esteraromaticum]|uniref:IclR family transcriptional regulator n=1 Tax=Microbacterium esteraromaticum TaxID=57043 RepID=UPI001C95D054|nr:IclR family transcriptional regulator [Microbacterium esteraromaticum]MBY6060996.1 IclR family transcriptional regulator [Microbacterium esteraromaticum]
MDEVMDNAVAKAVHVLGALRRLESGASARELASVTGLPRSTVQRLLTTLAATGMVSQDRITQKYKIGPRALLIGLGYNSGLTLVTEARPQMIAVRNATGETVGLSVAVDHTRVFLEEVQSTEELRFAPELGKLYPLWSGANGRVLMGGLTAAQVDEVLRNRALDHAVDHPLSDDDIRQSLRAYQENGFATAFNEAIDNVNSVAIPVRDATGAVAAAMSISGPSQRFTPERMSQAIDVLGDAADTVTRRLGGTPLVRPTASISLL